jgi:hypothetical protein
MLGVRQIPVRALRACNTVDKRLKIFNNFLVRK